MKFMPQKREKGLSRSVNFMKFLEREVFAISGRENSQREKFMFII
jgi:hypothetical protein